MYKNSLSKDHKVDLAKIELKQNSLVLSGSWTWTSIDEEMLSIVDRVSGSVTTIDGINIEKTDTTGMYFIHKLCQKLANKTKKTYDVLLDGENQLFFDSTKNFMLVEKSEYNKYANEEQESEDFFSSIATISAQLLEFFGYLCFSMYSLFKKNGSLSIHRVVETIQSAGIKGVLITSGLCFLLGVNLTYQMAPQFSTYGANIYVVNFLGIALLREVTPLITAIIVAGRTGSAIAASIGTMKVQEEIDALSTMGISPMQRLIVPQVIGLLLALPVLTMIADVASMFGGLICAGPLLGITPDLFIQRLHYNVSINQFWIGVFKSFFFAWIIGMVGCYCGLKVKSNADSIGTQTTKSVVISICLIVMVDAIFAILFKILGVN